MGRLYWHTIYQDPDFQVSNLGGIRFTIPQTHSEHNYKSRLTYEQVILMRHQAKMGVSSRELAVTFGYSHGGVCNIIARRRWRDI
jgi:hypothetical protein